jgi:hypothetical protein
MSVNSLGYKIGKQPIAQSFFVDEPSGYYTTKIDLYFASTFSPTANLQLPVSMHLRPMRNGSPSDTEIVPGSVVYVPYNNVNTSTDASAATTFQFDEPIFLNGSTDYAIVVYAETPEYEIFISEIDEQILGSASDRVNVNPNLGSLFYSQNGATFTADQKQDLKFTLYRAKFDTTQSSTVYLNNASIPRKLLNSNSIRTVGGDSDVTVFSHNHGLQVNDTVSISGADTVGGLNVNGSHTITEVDYTGFRFKSTTAADSDQVGGGTRIITTQNIPYSIVHPSLSLLVPGGASYSAGYKGTTGKSFAGTETPYTVDANYNNIMLGKDNYVVEKNYVIAADSIADTEIGIGARTAQMRLKFYTNNEFVAPMLDLQRSSLTLIDNIIDNQDSAATSGFNVPLDFVNETSAKGGSAAAKHLTTLIRLGETAVGLKVFLSANKPKSTSFDLYYRTAAADEDLGSVDFTLVQPESTLPTDENPRVFREYEYLIGGKGGVLSAFTQFQLKIVMNSTNSAKVPQFKDLRAIALSV